MAEKKIKALPYIGYTQSANTLFHFMKKKDYLEEILKNCALIPRYCVEDVEYLDIIVGDKTFDRIAILQKCFCDIHFHKLADTFEARVIDEDENLLSDEEKREIAKTNTHMDYYGEFAIAFSKEWGEKNGLQPVNYLNKDSAYTMNLKELFNKVINSDDVEDLYADDVIERLSFIKPLRGKMGRTLSSGKKVNLYKNFCDEREWRYVPSPERLMKAGFETAVIAREDEIEALVEPKFSGTNINEKLNKEQYCGLWLHFEYNDIRYIIVPDSHARISIIDYICNISDGQFKEREREVLVSKILVLNEMRKDW